MQKSIKKTMVQRKKEIRTALHGRLYIQSTFNNTIVTITDHLGNVIGAASAGAAGFKGARKSTPYAAQIASKIALEKAKPSGIQSVDIFVSGVGPGREQAVRSLQGSNIAITSIKDITPIPHNGCRARKARRV